MTQDGSKARAGRIGILETGRSQDPAMRARHGDYPDMFAALFAALGSELTFKTWPVVDGDFPATVEDCAGWLITGSRASVYDDDPWIARCRDFVRDAHRAAKPLAGVCFGHQLLATALGGEAGRAPQGWSVGVRRFGLCGPGARAGDALALQTFNRDQVLRLPASGRLLARSEHSPCAVVRYDARTLSMQAHPELTAAFMRDLIAETRGDAVPEADADAGLATLDHPTDHLRAAAMLDAALRGRAGDD